MRDLEDVLAALDQKRLDLKGMDAQLASYATTQMPDGMRDTLTRTVQQYKTATKKDIDALVAELVRWPPHKVEHRAKLQQFLEKYPYEKSVFIMTKFPDKPPKAADLELQKVIDLVRQEVTACGFTSHLASDKPYHRELFKNIELYMLGCMKGIAIVESKHSPELNPNVTMEWGWLRSTDREVLFLIEKDFDRRRADIGGLIEDNFDWTDPEPGIKAAIQGFFEITRPLRPMPSPQL